MISAKHAIDASLFAWPQLQYSRFFDQAVKQLIEFEEPLVLGKRLVFCSQLALFVYVQFTDGDTNFLLWLGGLLNHVMCTVAYHHQCYVSPVCMRDQLPIRVKEVCIVHNHVVLEALFFYLVAVVQVLFELVFGDN